MAHVMRHVFATVDALSMLPEESFPVVWQLGPKTETEVYEDVFVSLGGWFSVLVWDLLK